MGIKLGTTGWIAIAVIAAIVVLALANRCSATIGPFGIH